MSADKTAQLHIPIRAPVVTCCSLRYFGQNVKQLVGVSKEASDWPLNLSKLMIQFN